MTTAAAAADRPEKIHNRHLDRLAVIYVRQSSLAQLEKNQESTKLQYSLVTMAERLGWARERILTIDDDLGLSAASAAGRPGFQRLLAEVALDHVGIILGVEMSRFARSNRDWHQLLELCARFGSLIGDLDGLYDPARYNDRLLLGLKGTMSEAELHILRQRLWQGKLQKAKRGELGMPVPSGYLRQPTGEVVLDPDEEVRGVIRLIFDDYERIGTLHGVLRDLVQHGVQVGVRRRTRPDVGLLEWHRPHRGMIANILRNPIYAGAYALGRRQIDPRRQIPGRRGSGRTTLLPATKWHANVQGIFPAYITWEQYQRNQARLDQHRGQAIRPSARGGTALLQGLVVCGRCQRRMSVHYGERQEGTHPHYDCQQLKSHYGGPFCCSFTAGCLDDTVARMALDALKPAGLDLSVSVAEDIERERRKTDALWDKRLQRARYEVERAGRQYDAVEPENRLVARTLESNWEQKLEVERALREERAREELERPRHLSAEEREAIKALAHHLPQVWHAASTTAADRRSVLRMLIDRVVVLADRHSEWLDVTVHWAGGGTSRARVRRPVRSLQSMERHGELLAEIRKLRQAGCTAPEIAEHLNGDGWTTPTQRNVFNERLVRSMLERYGSVPRGPRRPLAGQANEWSLAELARKLDMPQPTLYSWMARGVLNARRAGWRRVVIADAGEVERLRGLRAAAHRPAPPAPKASATAGAS